MDLNDLKTLLRREGGKIIIVEDGEPTMVISSYVSAKSNPGTAKQMPPKRQEPPPEPEQEPEPDDDELTIDDLPL
ncbi:MAG: hypothetical protein HYT50_00065 [Candidatus Wildermuthbacteria bacterium]|nr:hypothetical protein [Candidatus Wildermuthbacteria bacterium]